MTDISTQKKLLEKADQVLWLINIQSTKIEVMKQWKKPFYNRLKEERQIEISQMALSRLINYYNNLTFEIFNNQLPQQEKRFAEKYL
jgi:hypothetical protein